MIEAGMPRVVEPETLDSLAADDPAALRSRRDLRRIHLAMGTAPILRRALRGMSAPLARPPRVLELGAGDGSLLLGVAASAGGGWQGAELTLLDRQPVVDGATLDAYARLGWRATAVVADALEWAAAPDEMLRAGRPDGAAAAVAAAGRWDLIVASLFLHHFDDGALAGLLAAAAARCDRFVACEPRRGRLALAASRLVGAIGAGPVTREDAVTSVRAGFRAGELAALWPGGAGWRLEEGAAGPFGHRFVAERTAAAGGSAQCRAP